MTGEEYYKQRAEYIPSLYDDHYLYENGEAEIIKAFNAGVLSCADDNAHKEHQELVKRVNELLEKNSELTTELNKCIHVMTTPQITITPVFWHYCEDEQPKETGWYLAYGRSMAVPISVLYVKEKDKWQAYDVEAWTYLPEKPERKS